MGEVLIGGTAALEDSVIDSVSNPLTVLGFPFGGALDRRDAAIGAETDVIFTSDVYRVLDVLDDIDRHRLRIDAQVRPENDAGDAALFSQCAQRRIIGIARVIGQRAATGMTDQHWRR